MAEHRPARSESLQPHTERSSRPGPEPSSVEDDVYVWRYALLVVHAKKEEDLNCNYQSIYYQYSVIHLQHHQSFKPIVMKSTKGLCEYQ